MPQYPLIPGVYRCIFLAFLVPELLTLFRSLRICLMKTVRVPKFSTLCTVFVLDTLHVAGLATFVFVTLPNMDSIKAVTVMNCLALVPALLNLVQGQRLVEACNQLCLVYSITC